MKYGLITLFLFNDVVIKYVAENIKPIIKPVPWFVYSSTKSAKCK